MDHTTAWLAAAPARVAGAVTTVAVLAADEVAVIAADEVAVFAADEVAVFAADEVAAKRDDRAKGAADIAVPFADKPASALTCASAHVIMGARQSSLLFFFHDDNTRRLVMILPSILQLRMRLHHICVRTIDTHHSTHGACAIVRCFF